MWLADDLIALASSVPNKVAGECSYIVIFV